MSFSFSAADSEMLPEMAAKFGPPPPPPLAELSPPGTCCCVLAAAAVAALHGVPFAVEVDTLAESAGGHC